MIKFHTSVVVIQQRWRQYLFKKGFYENYESINDGIEDDSPNHTNNPMPLHYHPEDYTSSSDQEGPEEEIEESLGDQYDHHPDLFNPSTVKGSDKVV